MNWKTHSIWTPLGDLLWIKYGDVRICTMNVDNREKAIENAYKIVQCVNSCRNINPNKIPQILDFLKRLSQDGNISPATKEAAVQLFKEIQLEE